MRGGRGHRASRGLSVAVRHCEAWLWGVFGAMIRPGQDKVLVGYLAKAAWILFLRHVLPLATGWCFAWGGWGAGVAGGRGLQFPGARVGRGWPCGGCGEVAIAVILPRLCTPLLDPIRYFLPLRSRQNHDVLSAWYFLRDLCPPDLGRALLDPMAGVSP